MRNDYEIKGDVTFIYMINRKGRTFKTLIDTEDLPKLLELGTSWFAHEDHGKGVFYAETVKTRNKKRKHIGLHRLVTDCPPDLIVDHINHDTLDNRKSNLRITNKSGNGLNRNRSNKHSKSGVRGVYWHKTANKWVASIGYNGKTKHLGTFSCLKEAEKVVEKKTEKLINKQSRMVTE